MNEKCFALLPGRNCSALDCYRCSGHYDLCPFYKPLWMYERDQQRCIQRIASMPLAAQERISTKYYNGKKPWIRGECL